MSSISPSSARRWPPPTATDVGATADTDRNVSRDRTKTERRLAMTRWFVRLSLAYLALALLACAFLWGLADRWWPATVFLFGPRWILLLPLAVLVPAAVALRPSLLLPIVVAGAVVLVPVMGLRLNWPSTRSGAGDATLRVVTLNAAASQSLGLELPFRLEAWQADIVAVQECGSALRDDVQRIQQWHHQAVGELCLISRYPIREASATNWQDLARVQETGVGGSGQAVQYMIETPHRSIRFVNVHLETAREGLEGILELDFRRVAENTIVRRVESRRTREWLGQPDGALVIAGDFNLPVESAIYREYWSEFRNAFSEAGTGFGMTKENGWVRVRIDHILTGESWRTDRVAIEPVAGTDHRLVVAELRWVGSPK